MTDVDRVVFAEAMMILGETFNEPVSEVRIESYFSALSDLPMPALGLAVRSAVRTLKWFPKPVELREMVLGAAGDNADAAWAEVMTQIRRVGYIGTPTFTDPNTGRAVDEIWGSWRRLCETLPAEGPELIGWIKQFKATYASQAPRDEKQLLTVSQFSPAVRALVERHQQRPR